jgi:thiopeptide-type bacteriocin biosynthesis protein
MTYRSMPRFVLRTPTLPFDVLAAWGSCSDADARRDALRRLVDDPAVREALYLASPELDGQIAAWQREPETQSGVAVERALVRYISRMASRSTPFGLFASVSVGAIGGTTKLELPARAEASRHTRLDNDLLFALCNDLARDAHARTQLRYRPNSSLYLAAARLRYAEARLAGPVRAYHLVAVDRTSYLDALLARAAAGATRAELVDVLCGDPEITRDEGGAFVDEVVDAQILVPELAPAVTGREPTEGIIESLESQQLGPYAEPLRQAQGALQAIDAAPPGVPTASYRAIETLLAASLPTKVEANRLFQVDMFKPASNAVLSESVTAELIRGVELLHALTPAAADDTWTRFRQRFVARYETREVPLLEVLDEESGIGFGSNDESPRSAPLLADLALPIRLEPRQTSLRPRDVYLMSLVAESLRNGATEINLTDEDVEKLSEPKPLPLPDTIAVMASVVADSADAVTAGRYQVRINGVGRGAQLLGRFCHGSPEVKELTEQCLRAEEAFHPDAVFAEIVHLPEGRVGNVLLRPVLRGYEIPYLGTSGAAPDKQLAVNDLTVSVVEDRVILRSRRLGREVIPRMTTAHNYSSRSLTVYRFLCSHAQQNVGNAYWTWGVMNEMPFLPRVTRGRIVLERARWILLPRDLAPLEAAFAGSNAAKTPEQIRAIRTKVAATIAELRRRLRLPRWIVIGDGDNELPVDLDNELMVDAAAHMLKGRKTATVLELLPAPDQLCVRGVEGAFAHELVVMLAKQAPAKTTPAPDLAFLANPATPRRFLPGSSWLYLKLYTGSATVDTLLRDYLAPAIATAQGRGLTTAWFFLRFGDPDWHLRLRFAGDPGKLTGELLPFLHEALAPASERGLLWKIVVDTYEREIERYGGAAAIDATELLFHADSECALSIIESCSGDAGANAAWRLTLRGIDRLMDDLGFSLHDKLATMTAARDGFGAEIGMDTAFQKRLGEKFRAHGKEIAILLDAPDDDPAHPFGPAFEMFAARSRKLRPLGEQLRQLEAAGQLTQSLGQLVHSYIHMHVNRMIRSAQRLHELVLYDLLRRHYDGIAARMRHKKSA